MSYNYEHEETECTYNKYDEAEQMFQENMKLADSLLNQLKEDVQYSDNPWILENCLSMDLYNFIETGEFELPKYMIELNKTKQDLVSIPEPIQCSLLNSPNDWITLKSTQDQKIDEENKKTEEEALRRKVAEEEYQELLKSELEKVRAKSESNKHNWTMTREQRGLPKELPKPIPVKPKLTRNQRKKLSKKRFQVNKSNPSRSTV